MVIIKECLKYIFFLGTASVIFVKLVPQN